MASESVASSRACAGMSCSENLLAPGLCNFLRGLQSPFDKADKVLGANVIPGIGVDKVVLVHDELIDGSDSFYAYSF